MVIDFHTHTYPDKMAAATLDKLSGVSHLRPFTDGTAAGLAASMAQAGVDRSIVLPVATSPGRSPTSMTPPPSSTGTGRTRASSPSAASTPTMGTGRASWPGWPAWA